MLILGTYNNSYSEPTVAANKCSFFIIMQMLIHCFPFAGDIKTCRQLNDQTYLTIFLFFFKNLSQRYRSVNTVFVSSTVSDGTQINKSTL